MLKPPMVGRDDAMRTFSALLKEVSEGKGNVVFISGEAGIGKTRLAEEVEALSTKKGFKVMVGRCIPGAQTPYLPFQEAFRECSEKGSDRDMGISAWLTGSRQKVKPEVISPQVWKDQAFEAVSKSLREISGRYTPTAACPSSPRS
jgi:predicted ATPase